MASPLRVAVLRTRSRKLQRDQPGHADRTGDVAYNEQLPQQRVTAVVDELTGRLGAVSTVVITTDYRGETQPEDNLAQSRRGTITITSAG